MADTQQQPSQPVQQEPSGKGRIVLTDKLAPMERDEWFDDDPFVDAATGKRKKIEKAESSSDSKRAKKAEKRTKLLTCAFEELARVLPYAEDVTEGPCVVYCVYNENLHTQEDLEKETRRFCPSVSTELTDCHEGWDFTFEGDACFRKGDLMGLRVTANFICDKLMELKGTGAIVVVDGGQVNRQNKKAKSGDIAMLTLKMALLMLKLKDRALHDGLYAHMLQPGNTDYKNLLHDLGRAQSFGLLLGKVREHDLDPRL